VYNGQPSSLRAFQIRISVYDEVDRSGWVDCKECLSASHYAENILPETQVVDINDMVQTPDPLPKLLLSHWWFPIRSPDNHLIALNRPRTTWLVLALSAR